jgi:hypothetical protein
VPASGAGPRHGRSGQIDNLAILKNDFLLTFSAYEGW